jgi:hypothetical protein
MMEALSPWIKTPLKRCFIAAPAGLNLKALPDVLSEKDISWEWARDLAAPLLDPVEAIRAADFLIGIFNGTRGDYNVFYEVGIAVGLNKPIFLITNKRLLPLDLNQFPANKIPLTAREALALHLDIFLRTPKREIVRSEEQPIPPISPPAELPSSKLPRRGYSALERRAYQVIEMCGGRAVAHPDTSSNIKYRPDLLAWLGNQDAELLDPTIIEIKARVDPKDARRLEERLLAFMQSAGIRTGFVLTAGTPAQPKPRLSPYVFWLSLDEFEKLVRDSQLGAYVRDTRNRAMHGLRNAGT